MSIAISVASISKLYRLGQGGESGYRTLRESVSHTVRRAGHRLLGLSQGPANRPPDASDSTLAALKDVSFDVHRGEMVGIIGRNGAGKSTLLKILSHITEPTRGRVILHGKVGSLLEVGTGFHPELTGRENIYLNGAILGMNRKEIRSKYDKIVEFSEIARFMDTPVKRYSSGMYVRLAYAVSAHMEPDILLLDEVLAVGDLAFQRKCIEHAKRLRDRNATVLFVSHNMFAVKSMCDRVIYLSSGQIQFDGSVDRGIQLYEQDSPLGTAGWATKHVGTDPAKCPIHITSLETLDESGSPCAMFQHGDRMRIRLRYSARENIPTPNFILSITRSDNVACCNFCSVLDHLPLRDVSGEGTVEVLTPPLKLVSETYTLQVLVRDATFEMLYSAQTGPTFSVRDDLLSTHFGVFHEQAQWSILN